MALDSLMLVRVELAAPMEELHLLDRLFRLLAQMAEVADKFLVQHHPRHLMAVVAAVIFIQVVLAVEVVALQEGL